jgi:hypothetical protein
MEEIIFFAEKNEDGTYIAKLPDAELTEKAGTLKELREAIIKVYQAHISPKLIRLYFVKDRYDLTFYTKPCNLCFNMGIT